MNRPLVSVVMVVCNVDRFLAQAIESILGQTLRDFEFVIVDFGSVDDSLKIVAHYAGRDSRIRLHTIPHCGLAEARNASCQLARGHYLAIMDADDVSIPERLEWQSAFMEEHNEISVLGGAVEWMDANGKALITWQNPVDNDEIQAALLERCPLWQPTVLMKRSAFLEVDGYRAPFAPAEDYDLWLRMAERFKIANLRRVVLRYRIHPYQVSMRKRTQQTLSVLAARVAASCRRQGAADPLDSITEITPALVTALGVSQARMQNELVYEMWRWIGNMYTAGEYSTALQAALDTLQTDLKYVDRGQLADLHIILARLYWKHQKLLNGLREAAQAAWLRPVVVGRPLKSFMRRLVHA